MLLVALLSCTIPFLVVSASSSATAEAISSARFAEFFARIAAASAALLLCDADTSGFQLNGAVLYRFSCAVFQDS